MDLKENHRAPKKNIYKIIHLMYFTDKTNKYNIIELKANIKYHSLN